MIRQKPRFTSQPMGRRVITVVLGVLATVVCLRAVADWAAATTGTPIAGQYAKQVTGDYRLTVFTAGSAVVFIVAALISHYGKAETNRYGDAESMVPALVGIATLLMAGGEYVKEGEVTAKLGVLVALAAFMMLASAMLWLYQRRMEGPNRRSP